MWLLLAGCVALPSAVPDQPGTIDAALAPELLSAASPDLPYLVYSTVLTVQTQDYRSCPAYSATATGFALDGDCSDSSDVSWEGAAELTTTGDVQTLTLRDFGVSGLAGGWKADGTVTIETARGSTSTLLTARMTLTQLDSPARLYWIDTTGAYTSDTDGTGLYYADRYSGTIGVGDWGTATVDARRTTLGVANGCGYAEAGIGDADITGANALALHFHAPDAAGPRPPAGDTGFDTGAPPDTGDTASNDTAADDTATDDTGALLDTTGGTGCGCATLTLDGADIDTCAAPVRALTVPFFALGT